MIPIIVDTREQRPWTFPPERFTVTRKALSAGDYSIAGGEHRVALERKSLGDYVSTVIGNWLRFRRELNRLMTFDIAAIVVESNVEDVMQHKYESEAEPASVMGRAHGIFLDTGIPTLWWGSRAVCEPQVWQFLTLADKKLR